MQQRQPFLLSGIIGQLIRKPGEHTKVSPTIEKVKLCAYKGCNNPRHVAKSGNVWKKCKECSDKENKKQWAKKVIKKKEEGTYGRRINIRFAHRI